MNFISQHELIKMLPAHIGSKITVAIGNKQLKAVTVTQDLKAMGWPEIPSKWPPQAAWCHIVGSDEIEIGEADPIAEPVRDLGSKTKRALKLIETEGLTPYAAAKRLRIDPSIVHRAAKRREGKKICPCCDQIIQEASPDFYVGSIRKTEPLNV